MPIFSKEPPAMNIAMSTCPPSYTVRQERDVCHEDFSEGRKTVIILYNSTSTHLIHQELFFQVTTERLPARDHEVWRRCVRLVFGSSRLSRAGIRPSRSPRLLTG